jgi:phosphopantetheinyl transferase
MPLVYQQNINETASLCVWQITEEESFFLEEVKAQYPISNAVKRLQHLAGRYLLKYCIPDFPFHEVIGGSGSKPYLASRQYQFSVSHSGDYVSVLIGTSFQTGLDLEIKSNKPLGIRTKFLSEEEFFLKEKSLLSVEDFCTICWTVKETIFKWYGRGEVDFKQHIQIRSISFEGEKFIVGVFFTKLNMELNVAGLVFENYVLSWLIQDINGTSIL